MDYHMMESEQLDVAYQSEMVTDVSPAIENNEPTAPINSLNEPPTEPDGQSTAFDNDATQNPTNDINEPSNVEDEKINDLETKDKENENENENETPPNESNESKMEENSAEPDGDGDAEVPAPASAPSIEEGDEGTSNDQNDEQNDESSPLLKVSKRDDELDLNQCRICMSSTNLMDIFRIGEKSSFRICDLIMKIAPVVKIAERDFLPHSVCGACVDRIEAAYELRVQCEETDKILRSKLKRSKKTTRRAPSEFVLIDCADSSTDSDDDQRSDDEFQLSNESEESTDSDSDSSYDEKKKRTPNQRGWKRGPPKRTPQVVQQQQPPVKKPRSAGVVYIKAVKSEDEDGPKVKPTGNKLPIKPVQTNRLAFRCDVCNRPFVSVEALAQHRKTHTDEKCGICSMVFKQRSALLQHMQRHREDRERVCQKCQRVFVTKAECQRHIHMAHPETVACNKCKRYFPNKVQLDAHNCVTETSTKRKPDEQTSSSGRDLFKSVAPLTTTYWSDSFSD